MGYLLWEFELLSKVHPHLPVTCCGQDPFAPHLCCCTHPCPEKVDEARPLRKLFWLLSCLFHTAPAANCVRIWSCCQHVGMLQVILCRPQCSAGLPLATCSKRNVCLAYSCILTVSQPMEQKLLGTPSHFLRWLFIFLSSPSKVEMGTS